METRSKSQSGKELNMEINMADTHAENHSTGKQTLIKTFAKKTGDKINNSLTDSEKDGLLQESSTLNQQGVIAEGDNAGENALKGIVASRVQQINNTPPNSPLQPLKSTSMNKSKRKPKLRMVGAKDGKLSVEEEDSWDELGHSGAMLKERDHDENSQSADLISILRELTSTVKRLESKIDNIEKEKKGTNKKVREISLVQSQDSAAITDLTTKVDTHEEQVKTLTGIVA